MIELRDVNGEEIDVQAGESANVVASFNFGSETFDKAALLTITATLYDLESKTVINSREDQDVKDHNDATVSSEGVLTLRLSPADNVIVDADLLVGQNEVHVIRLTWTWNDGVITRTGIEELRFNVMKTATVS